MKKNCLIKKCFYSSVKDGTTGDNGEKLDGHISDEDCLTCKWMNLTWKIGVIITVIILEKMFCYLLMFLKSLLTCA